MSFVISIHAPLRERRLLVASSLAMLQFQSTLPYGSDFWRSFRLSASSQFQSTLPYGSDRNRQIPKDVRQNFNPRSLTGATLVKIITIGYVKISIHAPLRERPGTPKNSYLIELFQSTLPYGSDQLLPAGFPPAPISIHAPLRERRNPQSCSKLSLDFNPRSLTGATI